MCNVNKRRQSRIKRLQNDFTLEDWDECLEYFKNKCAYCGDSIDLLTKDHVVPVSKGGPYIRSNIVPACNSCNTSKGSEDFKDWYKAQDYFNKDRYSKINRYIKRG